MNVGHFSEYSGHPNNKFQTFLKNSLGRALRALPQRNGPWALALMTNTFHYKSDLYNKACLTNFRAPYFASHRNYNYFLHPESFPVVVISKMLQKIKLFKNSTKRMAKLNNLSLKLIPQLTCDLTSITIRCQKHLLD